ncbi:MAG: DUF4302 domain-containing protein, partial [Muribaculaceae bacterium]|nr:DUF4302 domain-containing protein [Muribaculaceae bacterium]
MNKKIFFVATVAASLAVLPSCKNEVDDLFDQSAADRIEQAMTDYNEALCSAENGWEMLYFANGDEQGYNLLCKFDKNGSVKFAAKNEFSSNNQYAEETSLFEMIADNGPVLTFNTYNKLFHIFADPNDIPSTGEDDETGFGHEGDYEFVVHEATADQIFLKGKKYGISIYLRKLPADLAWEDYFAQVEANKAKYFNSKVKTIWLETATKRYTVQDMTSGVMSFVPEGGDAVSETLYKAYILTYDGKLHFITPFKGIDGKISLQNFDVAEDGTLVCSDEGETGHFTSDPVAQMFTADAYTWRIDKNANVGSWETAYNALTNGILAYKKKSPLQYVEFSYDSKTTVEGYPYLLSIKTKSYL